MINRKEYNYDIAGLVEGIAELKADYINSMSDISNDIGDIESDIADVDINGDTCCAGMQEMLNDLDDKYNAVEERVNETDFEASSMGDMIIQLGDKVSDVACDMVTIKGKWEDAMERDDVQEMIEEIDAYDFQDTICDMIDDKIGEICFSDYSDEVQEMIEAESVENAMDTRDLAKDAILDYLPVYFDQMMAERRAKSLLGRFLAFADRLHWRMPSRKGNG